MTAFYILSAFFIICSYIHLIKYDAWWIRDFDFLHAQLAFITSLLLVAGFILFESTVTHSIVLTLLIITISYHLFLIIPFTVFHKKQVLESTNATRDNSIRVMMCNVYQDNTQYERFLALVRKTAPDVLLVVETNSRWAEALSPLDQQFDYKVSCPLENTYGMIFYSRLKIKAHTIFFLIKEDVPSFEITLNLPSGKEIKLFTAHPQPPSPTENEKSTERDAELMLIAKKVKAINKPTVVMGDLNDVAWSHSTRLFKRISGLLDPRIGRGLFNTFHAKIPLLRFPLDHLFSSHHFTLIKMERLPFCNSDHFPIFIELCYQPKQVSVKNQKHADEEDHKEAQEKIIEAKRIDS
jgi:endonuclease/exonuclease/phosphatase (EEP) superfamily protein YafD